MLSGRHDRGSGDRQRVIPTPKELFSYIYRTNFWGGKESRSGVGSGLAQTAAIRSELPKLIRGLGIRSVLDAPCGDFYWMRHVELGASYIGIDIVDECIAANRRFENDSVKFHCMDMVSDPMPQADMVICRDGLVHLTYADALKAVENFRASGAKYLLATTFTLHLNSDLAKDRSWRPLNLEQPPFSFPKPMALIKEGFIEATADFDDYRMGLWRLDDPS